MLYLSFLRSATGTGLTEIRGKVEMEPWDWLLTKEEVSRLSGDCGGVMRLGLLHSEWDREPGTKEEQGCSLSPPVRYKKARTFHGP